MNAIFHRMNTLARLSSVWHQAETVEIDVTQVSGALVVMHHDDYHLDQLELERMPWNAVLGINPHIPLFREYLTLATRAQIGVLIEAKGSTPEITSRVAEEIITTIAQQRAEKLFLKQSDYPQTKLTLLSFSVEALLNAQLVMKKNSETLNIALGWTSNQQHARENASTATQLKHVQEVSGLPFDQIERLGEQEWHLQGVAVCKHYGFDILCIHKSGVTKEVTQIAHANGLRVFTFIARQHEEVDYLNALGVDNIICEPSALYEKF